MAKKKKIYNADTGQWENESSSTKAITSQPSKGYDANTGSFYDIAPIKTTPTISKKNTTWSNSLSDGYDFGDVTKTILGTAADVGKKLFVDSSSDDIAPTKIDTKSLEKDYSNLSRKQLLKERDDLQQKILKKSNIKNEDGGYNIGGMWNAISGQTKKDEESQQLEARMKVVNQMIEDNYVSNKKYDKNTTGFVEKSADTITGNVMSGVKGIESTTRKILGQETDSDLTVYEKLSNKARQDSKGAEGVYLDVVGSVARMTPQIMVSGALGGAAGVTAATTLGFANYGGGAYNQAIRDGYSEDKAVKYGAAIGTMEMVTEKVLGGLGHIYGETAVSKATSKVIDKLIPKLIKNKAVRDVLNSAMSEGTEEFLQEYLENIAKDTILDKKGLLKSTYNNITDTNVLSDALYSGFVGGLTGGVMQVQPAVDKAKYEKATGRNAETGLTINEQTVVDKVTENKTTEIQKKQAIEKEANRIIDNQGKLYGDLTETEKNSIIQEVTERMDRGEIDFSNEKVSKKELKTIADQVRTDLQKGRIDTDVIENTLGKEVDLSKDDYLKLSYDEKNRRTESFKYESTENDSEIRKNLAATTDVLNNTIRSHELFETVSKIADDTNTQYAFVNNEKLDKMGYKVEGKTVDGLVRESSDGTNRVLINVDSPKALNSIVGHETTHLLEGTAEYKALQEAIKNYAESKGEYDTRLETMKEIYKDVKNANIENEVTSDLVGDYIFTEEKFVTELASTQPTVFERVYNYIKHIYDLATAGSKEQRQLEKAKYLFEKAYNKVSNTTTQQTNSNSTTKASSNQKESIKYSLTDEYKTKQEINKDIKELNKQIYSSDISKTLRQELKNKVSELKEIKKTLPSEEQNTQAKTISQKDYIKQSVDSLISNSELDTITDQMIDEVIYDSPEYQYQENNESFDKIYDEIVTELEKEGFSKRYEESKDRYIYDTQELAQKGYNELLDYLDKQNIDYEVSRSTEAGYVPSVYIKNANGDTILRIANHENGYVSDFDMTYNDTYNKLFKDKDYANWKENILPYVEKQLDNTKYSLTDNKGRELSEAQQEYFKDSKVRDEEGNLKVVYHGSPFDFTKFSYDFVGTNGTALGKGFYLTDSISMAKGFSSDTKEPMKLYANITKPLSLDELNITKNQFKDYVREIAKQDEYYLWDYIDVDTVGFNNAVNKAVDDQYQYSDNDVDLIHGVLNTSTLGWEKGFRILKDTLGYDGVIKHYEEPIDQAEGSSNVYVALFPEQIKNVDNPNPTLNEDIRMSLSNEGQEVAPTGDYNIYGKDVKYVDPNSIPITQEDYNQLAPTNGTTEVNNDLANNNNFKSLEETVAPIKEQITELSNKLDDIIENRVLDKYTSEDIESLGETGDKTSTDLTYSDEIDVKNKTDIVNDLRSTFNINTPTARAIYDSIKEYNNVEDIAKELQSYKQVKMIEQDNYLSTIKNHIKGTKLDISHIKNQLTDFNNSERMSLMGKGLVLANSGQPIDSFYQELSTAYPGSFPSDITTEVDQLQVIADFMRNGTEATYTNTISDEEINNIADKLFKEINTTEDYRAAQENNSMYDYRNRRSIFDSEPYASDTNIEKEIAPISKEYDYNDLSSLEENTPEGIVDTRNSLPTANEVLDLYLQNQYDKINRETQEKSQQKTTPKVEKSKFRQFKDTLQNLVTNRNVEIDNLAKESGNQKIKYAGDMLNSVAGEVSGDIYTAQTDNEGHAIGKSLSSLFEKVKENGKYDAFNDYLEQYSNIDRHKQGKGSTTPLEISKKLVKQYEQQNPEFKALAEDVWQYGKNIKNNMVDSGLISEDFSNRLSEMYPHYVPFMENREMSNFYPDLKEAKPKGVIKRAEGGAENLLAVENALIKYTYAYKKATRQNQLYQEIVNTLSDKVDIGADVRSDPTQLDTSLYQDESGNYLTAYVDGEQKSVKISDDLYKGLKKDLEHQVRDLEQKLSLVTTPLQKISEVRRNLLTTWSPTFIITNPLKDIQDAVFNSKHTMSMLKNYPSSFYELSKGGRTDTAKQFLTLYGSGNIMGDFNVESGLNKGNAVQKNTNFLNGIASLNDIVELAPRYAEFKASLEHGASVQEAMYNAREVTTNFNRGGVITKALNRNGATFLNASVQGFDKMIRNFSGENGAKGVAGALTKVAVFGIIPALFNHLVFDDDDDDYKAIPDYIKDNYYLIETGNGNFIRIPKGRMLSVFGSAARRTLEYAKGEKNAFDGYLNNAYSQVGVGDPSENNIFAPFLQAFGSENGEAWYGGDLIPSRLQDKAPKEQYDSSTDKLSIWLGDKLNVSPYKINYILDQYSGGIGDMLLPLITEEAQSDSDSPLGTALAPLRDKFTADSTNDNKYAGEIYTLSDKMKKASSKEKESDEYKIQNSYLHSVTSEMGKLYQEKREVQADKELSKSEKYKKVQNIQKEINELAKNAVNDYENVTIFSDNTPYYGKGNIDLNNRPVVKNKDGSISTVRSMSFEEDGKEVLIPTVVNGKVVSNDEAIKHYYETGEYLGKFDTVEEANKYAEKLHKEQEKQYSNKNTSGSYATVGNREYYKNANNEWKKPNEDELNELNSLGMDISEKNSYFKAKNNIYEINETYKQYENTSESYSQKKREIIDVVKNSDLTDDQKGYLYSKYYSKEKAQIINTLDIDFDVFLDFESQNFTADKYTNGKTVSGSKKKKVFDYINSMNATFEQKVILAKLEYKSYNEYNNTIIDYLNNSSISYDEEAYILKKLGFKVDDSGNIRW